MHALTNVAVIFCYDVALRSLSFRRVIAHVDYLAHACRSR